ncbi:hypothetical protein [Nevskia sp.]|uniref:hypothetical protein n=1 Tax=Nevskia sp. TaxID=1929292 RepID=UPI003F729A33
MGKRIGVLLTGLALSLPLLTAIGGHGVLRGSADSLTTPAPQPSPTQRPAAPIIAGTVEPSTGIPCRRSAAAGFEAPPSRHPAAPNTGCNLRLVKRRPADPTIWI